MTKIIVLYLWSIISFCILIAGVDSETDGLVYTD
jgi:hypothetical protein